MSEIIIAIVISSLFSSILTGLLMLLAVQKWKKQKLDHELENVANLVGEKVKQGVMEAVDEKLPLFQEKVKTGMIQGLMEVTSISPDVKNAVELIRGSIEESLGLVFGKNNLNQK
ncbi:MAG: hypothetical protein D6767_01590 [Candidatus Hydrogenedentota bacterium]|nr:MAG: hypothetical protein D6767_01590 [Candidatus Hydrogenedentota bacterium]